MAAAGLRGGEVGTIPITAMTAVPAASQRRSTGVRMMFSATKLWDLRRAGWGTTELWCNANGTPFFITSATKVYQ